MYVCVRRVNLSPAYCAAAELKWERYLPIVIYVYGIFFGANFKNADKERRCSNEAVTSSISIVRGRTDTFDIVYVAMGIFGANQFYYTSRQRENHHLTRGPIIYPNLKTTT